ncbi:unnamed protein product, partial [Prorocentrum cordatum]
VSSTCGFSGPPAADRDTSWASRPSRGDPGPLFQEVPGVEAGVLERVRAPGGSLEEKLELVLGSVRASARRLEGMQLELRHRAMSQWRQDGAEPLPQQVGEAVSEGTYQEAFLDAFDGQAFPLYAEEVAPAHVYSLALEVHSGGPYWCNIPVRETGSVRHRVETVSASSAAEGSASAVSHFGAAQRGAVFVWRWRHLRDAGPHELPAWLQKALGSEGNDPVRKLQAELEAVRRWAGQQRLATAQRAKGANEVKDIYMREVLRLWPCEPDPHGSEQLKPCAWVEGLDAKLFVGRSVLVCRAWYDEDHALALHAAIARRHAQGASQEGGPPYRLTAAWRWTAGRTAAAEQAAPAEAVEERGQRAAADQAAPAAAAEEPLRHAGA